MPRRCVAGGCGSTTEGGYKLHSWPKNPQLGKIWTRFVRNTRANWTPTKWSLLCSGHFVDEAYETSALLQTLGYQPKLKDKAVPTIKPKRKLKKTLAVKPILPDDADHESVVRKDNMDGNIESLKCEPDALIVIKTERIDPPDDQQLCNNDASVIGIKTERVDPPDDLQLCSNDDSVIGIKTERVDPPIEQQLCSNEDSVIVTCIKTERIDPPDDQQLCSNDDSMIVIKTERVDPPDDQQLIFDHSGNIDYCFVKEKDDKYFSYATAGPFKTDRKQNDPPNSHQGDVIDKREEPLSSGHIQLDIIKTESREEASNSTKSLPSFLKPVPVQLFLNQAESSNAGQNVYSCGQHAERRDRAEKCLLTYMEDTCNHQTVPADWKYVKINKDSNECSLDDACERLGENGLDKCDTRQLGGETFCGIRLDDACSKNPQTLHVPDKAYTGEKAYKCTRCDYKCCQKVNLTNQIRSHTGEKPYNCTICDFRCSKTCGLTYHSRTHTGEKCYKCTLCAYKCSRTSNLTKHIRTHT